MAILYYCPQKVKPHRTWLTVGGNCIDYPWNKSTPTANLTTAKLLFNSTISTPGASFYDINLANFCLNTPMECYEYMRLWLDILPQEIIDKYNLTKLSTPLDGCMSKFAWVFMGSQRLASLQTNPQNTPCLQRLLSMSAHTWPLASHVA